VKFVEYVDYRPGKSWLNVGSDVRHTLDFLRLPPCNCWALRRTVPLRTSATVLVQLTTYTLLTCIQLLVAGNNTAPISVLTTECPRV